MCEHYPCMSPVTMNIQYIFFQNCNIYFSVFPPKINTSDLFLVPTQQNYAVVRHTELSISVISKKPEGEKDAGQSDQEI